jgi:hypothetical protein
MNITVNLDNLTWEDLPTVDRYLQRQMDHQEEMLFLARILTPPPGQIPLGKVKETRDMIWGHISAAFGIAKTKNADADEADEAPKN